MHVTVTIEGRMIRTRDGAVWTGRAFNYSFWRRYLDVFDHVNVAVRLLASDTVPAEWQRADGDGVSFHGLPYYHGPFQYLLKVREIRRTMYSVLQAKEAVILRVPGVSGSIAFDNLSRTGQPYGVEVVADPYDIFAPNVIQHPLRRFLRAWFTRGLRRIVSKANAVAYVTAHTLQQRYPPSVQAYSTNYSSVTLEEEAFVSTPRPVDPNKRQFTIAFVGSLAQLYKAPDVLIDAVGKCVDGGLDLELLILGGGEHQADLAARAARMGIRQRISFLGQVPPGEAVRGHLDKADVFVLPSRTEALPRAMIEAMARALPCIGTQVGGIPELLPDEDMIPPNDSAALADKISEVLRDHARRDRMAARNLVKAREYHREILRERRRLFYQHVCEATEAWLKSKPSS